MKKLILCSIVFFAGFSRFSISLAQETTDDHAVVWAAVEAIWEAQEKSDTKWVDEMLAADFVGWSASSPAPRSRASTRTWARFDSDLSKSLAHELYPLSIVVHGDTAVVHYLYTSVSQDREKVVHRENGRYTDVLVRDDGEWKFISWHGGSGGG